VTIDCRQLCSMLFEYVNGELPDDRRESLEAHLRACPPCVIHMETYRVTVTLSRKLPCRPMSPDCERRLREALARECPGQMLGDE